MLTQEAIDEAAGAVGGLDAENLGGGADAQNLQQGVGALMNAMRDLLNNIRPVDPPLENAPPADDNDARHDDLDEWD